MTKHLTLVHQESDGSIPLDSNNNSPLDSNDNDEASNYPIPLPHGLLIAPHPPPASPPQRACSHPRNAKANSKKIMLEEAALAALTEEIFAQDDKSDVLEIGRRLVKCVCEIATIGCYHHL